ncbi:putative DNA binding domain-containing protein [Cellulomonas sp. JH27-2]|uniref:ATP-binding protein n=1 Tax=Cellulomonas sp. JH27-2 TaxID=2774139 RepID=UPI001782A32C|nr:ATP-binding protein [Cellulomonas sp. JH27-2]MBD8059246.1 putative DNA binding domain-containing protein [Cellulomonas sp. JH27-2]
MAYPLYHEAGPRDLPMTMVGEEFRSAFPCESDYIEFKQGLPETKIREAVTAFSNSDGGVVLLGVRNDGVPQGISTDGETVARIHRMVTGVRNPGRYDIRALLVDDKSVLALSVHRRREGFAQMNDGRVMVRRGAMNTPLFDAELATFISSRALARFESTALKIRLRDAQQALIERVRAASGWSGDDLNSRLREAGLIDAATDDPALTVAGALYLLDRPADVLGKAYVEVFRYRDGSDTYDRRLEIAGPIDQQVEQATQVLLSELGADVVILGVHRHELPRVPEAVLREAVANAVAHRTYETTGQAVRIEIRPDRLIIRSPGGLPEPVTLANIREQNAARNVDTIKLLRRFRLAEDAGLGIDVMQDAMEAALLEPPAFSADQSHVAVTLPLNSTVTPQERAWISEIEQRGDIRSKDRVLLLHAARGQVLTNGAARDLLGVDSVHARNSLQRLRDQGYLEQSGERGGASYVLASGLGPPAGLRLDHEGLENVVLSMAAVGRITNEDVRARTGLDRARVLTLLTGLVEHGRLTRHGQRRGTYYTLP